MSGPDLFAASAVVDPPPQSSGTVSFADAEKQYPDHEILKLLFELPAAGMPNGFKCLIKVPKAKIEAVLARGEHPPFWRHGELIRIRRGSDEADAMP